MNSFMKQKQYGHASAAPAVFFQAVVHFHPGRNVTSFVVEENSTRTTPKTPNDLSVLDKGHTKPPQQCFISRRLRPIYLIFIAGLF